MTRAHLSAIAGLALLVCPASAAAGGPTDARARAAESFRQGQAAFERREFAAAAAAFEAAAGFVAHPAALLSAAEAWERAGDPARAADDCDRARALPDVAQASANEHVDYAGDATRCVERLRRRVGLLDLHGAGALAVRIDAGAEQVLPVRRWVPPGRHALTIVDLDRGRTRQEDVTVAPGEQTSVELSVSEARPAPTPMPAPTPASAPGRRRVPTSAWLAFGVAAPAAVAYGLFAFMTLGAKNDYDAEPTPSSRDAFYRDRTLADVTFGVAAVAAAAGIVLWLAAPSSSEPSSAARLSPALVRF